MSVDAADFPGDGQNPVAETDQTRGLWIGALCLLLAVPVTAWGFLNEPDRMALWLFVPPLVASVLAVLPLWLLWRSDPSVGGRGLIVYAVLFPILGVPVYLLYFLPVLGAWMLAGLGLGLGSDLFPWYLGIWWLGGTVSSFILFVSRSAGLKTFEWILPGIAREDGHPWKSYFSMMMPWLVPIAWVLQSRWWRAHRKTILRASGIGIAAALIIAVAAALAGPLFEPPGPSESGSTVAGYYAMLTFLVMVIVFLVLVLFGVIAQFSLVGFEASGGSSIEVRPALIGLAVLVASAFFAGTVQDLVLEIALTPATWAICLVAVLPVLAILRPVLMRTDRAPRMVLLLALAEYPIAYYPFYIDANETHFIVSARDRADSLIETGNRDEAKGLLSESFDKAVRRGLTDEAAEVAARWIPLLLDDREYERALFVAREAIRGLGEVPFGWYAPPAPGEYQDNPHDPVPRQRALVLELSILESEALMALHRQTEAVHVGLDAWKKAVEARMWPHLRLLAETFARMHRTLGANTDAYWWLRDARNRIARGGGPPEEMERLDTAIAELRRAIGEAAFRTAVEECARKDPEWCGSGSE